MTQDEALNILKTGANVFLTGEPGSGKTHTVNAYAAYLRSFGVEPAITASTGIAATHIGGQTLHSWCGIGVRPKLTPYDLDSIAGNRKVMARVGNTHVLVIDEVSMLSAETLAMADAVCRTVRRREEPFGGLQVVLVGDFFQLPPISRREETGAATRGELFASSRHGMSVRSGASDFAFSSRVWERANPIICYLSEQHRQEDAAFLEFLGAVRRGAVAERHKALLRTRYKKAAEGGVTELYSHNADVDHINAAELAKLPGEPRVFVMTGKGPDALVASLRRGCLSPEVLSLKTGARVIFTKNDAAGRFVNGTLGTVIGFAKEHGTPLVETGSGLSAGGNAQAGRRISAEPIEWNMQEGGRILARITQVPLRLAWAITVHKSQGMSLDGAHMDLSDAFEYGQGYVALSRVRSLRGLSLSGLNARALEVHPSICAKDARFKENSAAAREKFRALPLPELKKMHDNFLRAVGGRPGAGRAARAPKEKTDTLEVTKVLVLQKLSLPDIAEKRGQKVGTILNHLERLKEKGSIVPARDLLHLSPDPDRFVKMEKAFRAVFAKTKELRLSPARDLLDDSFSFEELRLARLFLFSPTIQ